MIWLLVALQVIDVIVTVYGVESGLVVEANPLIAQNLSIVYVKPFVAYLGGQVIRRKVLILLIIGSAVIDLVGISSLVYMAVLK